MHGARAILPLALAALVVANCAHPDRQPAVPPSRTSDAQVPGFTNIRYRVDLDAAPFREEAKASLRRELAWRARTGQRGALPPAYFLAISGGGDDGAFGAGLLSGWSAAGTRPSFKVVTGVSTGALTAPFAFLGPEYDVALKEVYTQITLKDVADQRGPLAAIFDDAMADSRPLLKTISRYVTPEFLAKIAAEYEKGRILLVASHDLDARRPVIWNMTAIAASGHPQAAELFRHVLLSSASIPGVFPPVMVDVEVDGQRYQEMHVDGGTSAQVFIYPPSLEVGEAAREARVHRDRYLYVIRNGRLDPMWQQVERRTIDIAGRSISALIEAQGLGDLYKIYLLADRDDIDYNLAFIPADFQAPYPGPFDPAYMRPLFDFGYNKAVAGYPWQKLPPFWVEPRDRPRTAPTPKPPRLSPRVGKAAS